MVGYCVWFGLSLLLNSYNFVVCSYLCFCLHLFQRRMLREDVNVETKFLSKRKLMKRRRVLLFDLQNTINEVTNNYFFDILQSAAVIDRASRYDKNII